MRTFRRPDCSPGFLIGLAVGLLMLPLRWFLAMLFAAGFHELCHLLALKLCGGQIVGIRLGAAGAVIHAAPLPHGKSLLCSLAGVTGGLLLILLARWFPRLALCAAVQSAYNLLPLRGLDGGHALRCFLDILFPVKVADPLCLAVERITLILVCFFCLYCTFLLNLGILPILAAGSLIIRATNGKIPCKS